MSTLAIIRDIVHLHRTQKLGKFKKVHGKIKCFLRKWTNMIVYSVLHIAYFHRVTGTPNFMESITSDLPTFTKYSFISHRNQFLHSYLKSSINTFPYRCLSPYWFVLTLFSCILNYQERLSSELYTSMTSSANEDLIYLKIRCSLSAT